MYIISGIILFILTAVLLYHYFHNEINSALAKAAWIVSRHKKKQILLSEEDKKKLLINLLELEQKIHRFQISEILNKYAVLLRYYLTKVCGKDLTPEFNLDELKESYPELGITHLTVDTSHDPPEDWYIIGREKR